jgi:hypothetical protein
MRFQQLGAPAMAKPGRVNSLALRLLAVTAPGVPDVYQGCELWATSLVDPDNRRLVGYERRRRLLDRLPGASPEEVLAGSPASSTRPAHAGSGSCWRASRWRCFHGNLPPRRLPASSAPAYDENALTIVIDVVPAAYSIIVEIGSPCLESP